MKESRPAVLIPAWNEEASVGDVIRTIHEAGSFDVIVIDYASTDRTAVCSQQERSREPQ